MTDDKANTIWFYIREYAYNESRLFYASNKATRSAYNENLDNEVEMYRQRKIDLAKTLDLLLDS